ncbi:MAG: hypothetical protein EBT55_00225 [Proteobacteria bacterium]|nr:hypothetical protein [Pseudomonadota bacterium]
MLFFAFWLFRLTCFGGFYIMIGLNNRIFNCHINFIAIARRLDSRNLTAHINKSEVVNFLVR